MLIFLMQGPVLDSVEDASAVYFMGPHDDHMRPPETRNPGEWLFRRKQPLGEFETATLAAPVQNASRVMPGQAIELISLKPLQ